MKYHYARLYVRNDETRLRLCTLPIHALLHIADDIETMGPVWAYWAFPMERFCGALARASKSRRYPYSSLNRRVLQTAQLSQIKLIYGLTERLDLEDRRDNIATGQNYPGYPGLVFVRPRHHRILHSSLHRKVAQYVGRLIHVPFEIVRNSLVTRRFEVWGKMQQTETSKYGDLIGGDLIRGHGLASAVCTRDASHVKVRLLLMSTSYD